MVSGELECVARELPPLYSERIHKMFLIRLNTFFSDSRHDLQRNLKKKFKLKYELETNRDLRVERV